MKAQNNIEAERRRRSSVQMRLLPRSDLWRLYFQCMLCALKIADFNNLSAYLLHCSPYSIDFQWVLRSSARRMGLDRYSLS